MTEQEWLACTDPDPMLEFVQGKASERKLRLFAVACCRQVWHLIRGEGHRAAIDVAERFADGMLCEKERQAAHTEITNVRYATPPQDCPGRHGGQCAAWYAVGGNSWYAAYDGNRNTIEAIAEEELGDFNWWHKASDLERAGVESMKAVEAARSEMLAKQEMGRDRARKCHADLLRCIIGPLPFRPVTLNPAWIAPSMKLLAQSIYEERAFDRLPVLADAFEKSGCTDADILNHCRQPGKHVRVCWVVDLILGKQ